MFDEVELNAQRAADVEVPLFVLEQKVEQLEQQFAVFNFQVIEKLTGQVCQRIDKNPSLFMPNLLKTIDQLKHFKNEYETKMALGTLGNGQSGGFGSLDEQTMKDLKFVINNNR